MPKHTIEAIVNPNVAPTAIGQHWINTASKRHWLAAGDSLVGDWIEQTESTALSDGDRGDITVSADGATWTVDNGAISLAKMANLSTQRIIGRTTSGTGAPEALTPGQATAILDTFTGTLKGLAPASGGGTSNFLRADGTWAAAGGGGSGDALTTDPLSQFAATTSLQLKGVISDETGSGSLVFATSPTLVTPILGIPTSGTLTNCIGLPISTGVSGLGTGVAAFLATPSSANLATALTDESGSNTVAFTTSPTFITPTLGVSSATSLAVSTGTITDPANGISLATTWNDAADTFTALKVNATDTASAANSLLADFQAGGSSVLSIGKNGQITASFNFTSQYNTASVNFVNTSDTGAIVFGSGADAWLRRISANHLGLSNGSSAQSFSVYNTFTSSTNLESFSIKWESNEARLWSVKGSGGGTARDVVLGYDETEKIRIGSAVVGFSVAPKLPSYTVAGVPSAATAGSGAMIYVSNESGGAVVAFSDGTNWKRVTDRATIS